MKKVLYLTDLYYDAKGREYFREDLFITGYLKDYFDLALCNPRNLKALKMMLIWLFLEIPGL